MVGTLTSGSLRRGSVAVRRAARVALAGALPRRHTVRRLLRSVAGALRPGAPVPGLQRRRPSRRRWLAGGKPDHPQLAPGDPRAHVAADVHLRRATAGPARGSPPPAHPPAAPARPRRPPPGARRSAAPAPDAARPTAPTAISSFPPSSAATSPSSRSVSSRSSSAVRRTFSCAAGCTARRAGTSSLRTRTRAYWTSSLLASSRHASPRARQYSAVCSRVTPSSGRTSHPSRADIPSSARLPGEAASRYRIVST